MKCHYANALLNLLNLLIKFLTYSKKHLFTVKKYLKTFWKMSDNLTAISLYSECKDITSMDRFDQVL